MNHSRRRHASRLLAVLALPLLLAGCGGLKDIVGPPPPLQLYMLRPAAAPPVAGAPVRWQLVVAVPDAPASLDGNRIALNPTPATMDYFANASWPDRVPLLVQGLLVEALDNTHRISAARDTAGLAPDYVLQSDIRDFQAHYAQALVAGAVSAPPEIVVEIEAKLVASPDQRIIGSLDAVQRVTAQANTTDSIVAAFNQALGAALAQIVDWTLKTAPAG
jgi:cholesterol transport system auxiliary component